MAAIAYFIGWLIAHYTLILLGFQNHVVLVTLFKHFVLHVCVLVEGAEVSPLRFVLLALTRFFADLVFFEVEVLHFQPFFLLSAVFVCAIRIFRFRRLVAVFAYF